MVATALMVFVSLGEHLCVIVENLVLLVALDSAVASVEAGVQ